MVAQIKRGNVESNIHIRKKSHFFICIIYYSYSGGLHIIIVVCRSG